MTFRDHLRLIKTHFSRDLRVQETVSVAVLPEVNVSEHRLSCVSAQVAPTLSQEDVSREEIFSVTSEVSEL